MDQAPLPERPLPDRPAARWLRRLLGESGSWRRIVLAGIGAGVALAFVGALVAALVNDSGSGSLDPELPTPVAPSGGPVDAPPPDEGPPPPTLPPEVLPPTEPPPAPPTATEPPPPPTQPPPPPTPTLVPQEPPAPTATESPGLQP